jgi:hypothetical protein
MLAPDPRFTEIDGLDGAAFEAALAQLFELLGYDVEHIGGFDKGADLILTQDGLRTAVQAKRWSTGVGIEAVRQLLDGMKRYTCDNGIVVTNSFFTEPAVECAGFHGIGLWDRWKLAEFVDGEPPNVDRTVCAECGARVTKGTTDWCISHPARYDGNVFCRKHQTRSQRRVP